MRPYDLIVVVGIIIFSRVFCHGVNCNIILEEVKRVKYTDKEVSMMFMRNL